MRILKRINNVLTEICLISDRIAKKENKHKSFIFLDMILCLWKYKASPNNYEKFQFYKLNASQRKTYVTYGISQKMIKKFNNQDDIDFFENKLKFAKTFNNEFKREYLDVSKMTFEDFSNFCKEKSKFICKPIDGSQGANIKVFHIEKSDINSTYSEIKENYSPNYMIEEWITQHEILSKIYPNAVNCLRIITVFDGVSVSILTGGVTFAISSEIANGSQPSIVAPVNFETGVIDKPAATFDSPLYEKHPTTNEQILGVKLPYFDEIKIMLENICRRVPTVGYIGWDFAISPDGPVLIEGNTTPGYKYYQIPKHLENGIGNEALYVKHL